MGKLRRGYVYILAGGKNGTLYIGVTNNLSARVYAHKQGTASVFTKKYGGTSWSGTRNIPSYQMQSSAKQV